MKRLRIVPSSPFEPVPITSDSLKFLEGFADGLATVFGNSSASRPVRGVGLALQLYYVNPFNLIPPAKGNTSFFDEVVELADNLRQAFRGGLFRRGDE